MPELKWRFNWLKIGLSERWSLSVTKPFMVVSLMLYGRPSYGQPCNSCTRQF